MSSHGTPRSQGHSQNQGSPSNMGYPVSYDGSSFDPRSSDYGGHEYVMGTPTPAEPSPAEWRWSNASVTGAGVGFLGASSLDVPSMHQMGSFDFVPEGSQTQNYTFVAPNVGEVPTNRADNNDNNNQENAVKTKETRFLAAESDWEKHREEITHLYVDKSWSLVNVMAHMKQEYAFDPTIHYYKLKLKSWGIYKYEKKDRDQKRATEGGQKAKRGKRELKKQQPSH